MIHFISNEVFIIQIMTRSVSHLTIVEIFFTCLYLPFQAEIPVIKILLEEHQFLQSLRSQRNLWNGIEIQNQGTQIIAPQIMLKDMSCLASRTVHVKEKL